MKPSFGIVSVCLLALGCATVEQSTSKTTEAAVATAVPLIDRDIFFDDPTLSGAALSPDGQWITFRKPYKGVVNLWVKRRDEPFEKARPPAT